jgi:hypothetical protein
MTTATDMLRSHPQKPSAFFDAIAECIDAAFDCELASITCADACLGEQDVAQLRQCIRLNLDTADICSATGRRVARQADPDAALWRAILEACAQACKSSGAECAKHASRHEHCKRCQQACERCEKACRELLQSLPSGDPSASKH